MNEEDAKEIASAIHLLSDDWMMKPEVKARYEVEVFVPTTDGGYFCYLNNKIDALDFIRERVLRPEIDARASQ